jgi:hypothetical protein
MQPFTPCRDKFLCLRCGIIIENGCLIHGAMHHPHSVSVFQINGGVQDHGATFRSFDVFMHGPKGNAM